MSKAAWSVVIEAGMQLSLKAGANFIDLGPSGISISGTPLVNINSRWRSRFRFRRSSCLSLLPERSRCRH